MDHFFHYFCEKICTNDRNKTAGLSQEYLEHQFILLAHVRVNMRISKKMLKRTRNSASKQTIVFLGNTAQVIDVDELQKKP